MLLRLINIISSLCFSLPERLSTPLIEHFTLSSVPLNAVRSHTLGTPFSSPVPVCTVVNTAPDPAHPVAVRVSTNTTQVNVQVVTVRNRLMVLEIK